MQYVFSMTSRMVTIAVSCALALCLLLFLLGMEIGARMSRSPAQDAAAIASVASVAPQPVVASQTPLDPGATANTADAADTAALPAPASSTP
jgi:Kef-type K+ transport system membrane component KefB